VLAAGAGVAGGVAGAADGVACMAGGCGASREQLAHHAGAMHAAAAPATSHGQLRRRALRLATCIAPL
jgi:6-phosphogluconate dehydrogenase (decarboxylating)